MAFAPFQTDGPFLQPSPAVAQLPGILRAAGFEPGRLTKYGILRGRGVPAVPQFELRHRCRGGGALELFCRLFVLALEESAVEVDAALAPLGLQPLIECGLLKAAGDRVKALAALAPVGELILARDFSPAMTGIAASDDHVLPVGASSMMTAYLSVRRAGERVLDLGCGQGFQMVMAGQHGQEILGTDISPRALNFAAFNVALNATTWAGRVDFPHFDYRLGSFFEPVEEWRGKFDLIVSNPPFIITPTKEVVAFTSNLQGDATVETIFRQSPAFLAEDGWCISLASWHHATAEDWAVRPTNWLRDSGCDALIVKIETDQPRDYALRWITELNFGTPPTEEQIGEWMEMFGRIGAGAITFGFVVMHKRPGKNWIETESLAYDYQTGPAGEQLRRIFAGRTFLHDCADAGNSVLDFPLRLLPGVRMIQRTEHTADGWTAPMITLAATSGIAWPLTTGEVVMLLLDECDGQRIPRDVLTQIAGRHEMNVDDLLVHGVEVVTMLIERGLVEVMSGGDRRLNPK